MRPINIALPTNRAGVWAGRQIISTFMTALGPPLPGTKVTSVSSGGVVGEWVRAPGVSTGRSAMYYIHGSGYVICSARTHRGLASRLSAATGLPVFVSDYRLAPEHRFPAAADDVAAGFRWLLDAGYAASDIVIGGDSAGGHLALDLLLENARTGAAQPAAVAMFSPLVDLTFASAAVQERRRKDPMISARAARNLLSHYTFGQRDDHPRLRLTIPRGATLPPIFVQAGGAEMLSADARQLQRMLRAAGSDCELEIWPGQMHVFQALPLLIPEASQALRRAAAFLTAALVTSAVQEVS